ncbi:HAD-IA family hydrolase [Streptomyces sp. NBC_00440]|uniref:HAD-IA family hydrolase n=1 Tax=unclassified Streptomyces TaxID=2593676 RepID=UPI002E23BFD2|nr:HAD-IA family hydrolase [Streptomyces sp. NBC_00932]
MPQIQAQALLFDMDGTLVDSTALVESTWGGFCDRHGLDLGEVLAFAHGRPTANTVSQFLLDAELAAAETRRLVAHEESETTGIKEIPGAGEFLAALPRASWAVVTSAGRKLAEVRLAAAGLPVPEVLLSADDVTHGKPHPEGYLLAAAALGADPGSTVVFEDSEAGVRAGLDTGGRTVVIGALATFDGVAERYADFRGFRITEASSPRPGVVLDVPAPIAVPAARP